MYYCKVHSIKPFEKSDISSVNIVNFGYKETDKEAYKPIKIYLDQIKVVSSFSTSRHLNYEEEIELFERIELGDEEAKNIIFHKFLAFVPRTVRYYVGNGVAIEDLVQEGNIALLEAIEKYDYRRGFRFSSFVRWEIRRRVRRYIPFHISSFDVPVESITIFRSIDKEYELETIMSNDQIISPLNSSRKLSYLSSVVNPLYLDCKDNNLPECIEDITNVQFEDEVAIKIDANYIIENYFDLLSDREENVIRLLYGLEDGDIRSHEIVGRVFGISKEKVRHIKLRAIKKILKQYQIDKRIKGNNYSQ